MPPDLEARPNPGAGAVQPANGFTLKSRAWQTIPYIQGPALILPVGTQAAPIYVRAGTDGDATNATTLGKSAGTIPRGAYLPCKGEWHVYYDAATTLECVILQDPAQLLALLALGIPITGGGGAAADVRDADAETDFAKALFGLLVNARLGYRELATNDYIRAMGNAPSNTGGAGTSNDFTVQRLFVDAILRAQDSSLANASAAVAVENRNADADADFAKALYGLLVGARAAIYNYTAADWARWAGGAVSQITGKSHSSNDVVGGNAMAHLFARETAGNTVNALEGRDFDAAGDIAKNLVGLNVNARGSVYDVSAANWQALASLPETSAAFMGGAASLQLRASGYFAGLRDREFILSLPADTQVTARNGYSATEPQILLVPPATNEWMLRRFVFNCAANIAVTTKLRFVIDPDNRYSAATSPTSFIPTGNFKSTNRGGSGTLAPTRAVYYDGATVITATAVDNDELEIGDFSPFQSANQQFVYEFEDGVIVPPSGTLLVYFWDNAATAKGTFALTLESANVQ